MIEFQEADEDGGDEKPASSSSKSSSPKSWDWRKDLQALLKAIGGLKKLVSHERASTAAIGNPSVIQCVNRLNACLSSDTIGSNTLNAMGSIQARILMGKKSTLKSASGLNVISLSKKDTSEIIDSQWDALKCVSVSLT